MPSLETVAENGCRRKQPAKVASASGFGKVGAETDAVMRASVVFGCWASADSERVQWAKGNPKAACCSIGSDKCNSSNYIFCLRVTSRCGLKINRAASRLSWKVRYNL